MKTAVLLVNLGTPDHPDADSIRRYLKQFLSDERVVDLPRWLWLPVLHLIILRVRPPKLVEKYQLVWGTKDGPIRNITGALARRVASRLTDQHVSIAMTYGNPSISSALDQLGDYQRLLVVPLFPQFAGATTGAVQDELARALKGRENQWQVEIIEEYHQDPAYIAALANSIRRAKSFRDGNPFIVFSFHGIPRAQSDRGDPYRDQCYRTAELVAEQLSLDDKRWRLTFQSRFGPAEWLQPYTDETMESLPAKGERDVLVVCPGFSVDCLETIEEIRELNREIFMEAGGEKFSYVKALNASHPHADVIAGLISRRLGN